MDIRTIRSLSVFSGVGGLDIGCKLAQPNVRTVCYVEREAYPIRVLVKKMEEGSLDQGPIWTDITTFDCEPWRGKVDCIIGAPPCQPVSFAGKRKGSSDERFLWPKTLEIVKKLRPKLCFFENVPGLLSLGLENIRIELQKMDYGVEAGLFSAEEVGAPHRRKRLFVMAYSRFDSLWWDEYGLSGSPTHVIESNEIMVNPHESGSGVGGLRERIGKTFWNDIARSNTQMGDANGSNRQRGTTTGFSRQEGSEIGREELADANDKRLEGCGCVGECTYERSPWPPSFEDAKGWEYVCRHEPYLEPAVQRVVNGLAYRVDRLRAVGNGVVPLQAAYAWRTLATRITNKRTGV